MKELSSILLTGYSMEPVTGNTKDSINKYLTPGLVKHNRNILEHENNIYCFE